MSEMNYNLPRVIAGPIDDVYHHTQAMNYGTMPHSILESRFEETTGMGDDENAYDNYARNTLTDRRPDTGGVASEEPRGSIEKSAGILNLRYNGHRGEAYTPYRPEYFDGFMGGEDRDPRGIQTDPDIRELVKQEQSRMRFIKFTSDACDQVTGGGVSEDAQLRQQQAVFKTVKGRLRVFDTEKDGRREGLRRGNYKYRSQFSLQQGEVRGYGDAITDYAMNPQRQANMICKQILRDTPAWREETADSDFTVAKYGQDGRKCKKTVTHNTVADALNGTDAIFSDADATRCYKTAGILMGDIVRGKRQCIDAVKAGDIDYNDAKTTMTAKTAPMERDLSIVTREIRQETRFATSDDGRNGGKSQKLQSGQQIKQVVQNHLTPAHHYLNAEIIFKSVRPGVDTRTIKNHVIRDATDPAVRDMNTSVGKRAKMRIVTGRGLDTADDGTHTSSESMKTVSYKHTRQCNGDKASRLTSEDGYVGVSDNSQVRRPAKWNYRVEKTTDTIQMMGYGNNHSQDRHTAPMGSKYTQRYIERDGRNDGGMSELWK